MSITLSHSGTTVTLDPDLFWSDEHAWQPVEQSAQRTVTGALVISVSARNGGRPITLQPEDDSSAWMSKATLDTLKSWAAVPGRQMNLNIRGTSYIVIFRHQDGAIEAAPLVHYNDVDAADWYRVTLRFLEI